MGGAEDSLADAASMLHPSQRTPRAVRQPVPTVTMPRSRRGKSHGMAIPSAPRATFASPFSPSPFVRPTAAAGRVPARVEESLPEEDVDDADIESVSTISDDVHSLSDSAIDAYRLPPRLHETDFIGRGSPCLDFIRQAAGFVNERLCFLFVSDPGPGARPLDIYLRCVNPAFYAACSTAEFYLARLRPSLTLQAAINEGDSQLISCLARLCGTLYRNNVKLNPRNNAISKKDSELSVVLLIRALQELKRRLYELRPITT